MSEQKLMKDGLNEQAIRRIASALSATMPSFSSKLFVSDATSGLDELELKQRVSHVITALARVLPSDYPAAALILQRIPECWNAGNPDDPIRGFAAWPLIDYSAVHGLQHPEHALETLRTLTSLFSSEVAIRPFILNHYDLTMKRLGEWVYSDDYHVRRLVSEGMRPRLPWAMCLPVFIEDPEPVLPLLEVLKDDPEEYVRRSVANHLNDISKDHPDVTLSVCRKWLANADSDRMRLIRHATRTLVKAGHPEVWGLLGYEEHPDVEICELTVEPAVIRMGESVTIQFKLVSNCERPQKLVLDYAVHHLKANGQMRPKVFKWTTLDLAPREERFFERRHTIRPITTRKYYAGEHAVDVRLNGGACEPVDFELKEGT